MGATESITLTKKEENLVQLFGCLCYVFEKEMPITYVNVKDIINNIYITSKTMEQVEQDRSRMGLMYYLIYHVFEPEKGSIISGVVDITSYLFKQLGMKRIDEESKETGEITAYKFVEEHNYVPNLIVKYFTRIKLEDNDKYESLYFKSRVLWDRVKKTCQKISEKQPVYFIDTAFNVSFNDINDADTFWECITKLDFNRISNVIENNGYMLKMKGPPKYKTYLNRNTGIKEQIINPVSQIFEQFQKEWDCYEKYHNKIEF